MNFFFNDLFTICDAPRAWGVYFQDSASPQMEALVELHDNIMFYLVIVLFGVGWILVSIIRNYVNIKSPISNKYFNHGTLIELIWTITPALILILIAFPSFKLLYWMDVVTDPSLTVFVEGHQWYWSYQYPDLLNEEDEELEFDSYLVPESELKNLGLKMDNVNGSSKDLSQSLDLPITNTNQNIWNNLKLRIYQAADQRVAKGDKNPRVNLAEIDIVVNDLEHKWLKSMIEKSSCDQGHFRTFKRKLFNDEDPGNITVYSKNINNVNSAIGSRILQEIEKVVEN